MIDSLIRCENSPNHPNLLIIRFDGIAAKLQNTDAGCYSSSSVGLVMEGMEYGLLLVCGSRAEN
jgi:hypothetical protein